MLSPSLSLCSQLLSSDQGKVLPVGRPKIPLLPTEISENFSEQDWEMLWWKKREALWFVADKLYQ